MGEWQWTWHLHPEVWVAVAVLGGGYWLALRRLGPRLAPPGEPVATTGQRWAWGLGVLSFWFALDWPLHDLAEGALYSAHMVQHLILAFVAPPLLLLGTPPWLARFLLRPVLRVVRQLARPLVALIVFNGVLAASHWPLLVEWTLRSEPVHLGLHAAVFAAAALMWMPVLSPILEIPRLPYPVQMFYLFLQSLVPTVPASFLTFGSEPLYRIYEFLPKLWGLSALDDQRLAGLIMKIGGGMILWTVIAILFFRWFSMEDREGADALAWRDVDRDLDRTELTKR